MLSVIIPTYNRKETLRKCLMSLLNQELCDESNDKFEIIVVDNGSSDYTSDVLEEFKSRSPVPFRWCVEQKRGPAAARNCGLKQAQGDLVLFIGDDIISAPHLLQEHLIWHKKFPEENTSVLGYVTWSPDLQITPFMRWLENGGPQFKFWSIDDHENVYWGHLVTANISFKRNFLMNNGIFDEDFPYAAYEDTELGFRLTKKGLRIVYNDKAIAYHHHHTSLNDALERMKHTGESFVIFKQKTGSTRLTPCIEPDYIRNMLGSVKYKLMKLAGLYLEPRFVAPSIYSYLMDKACAVGVNTHPATRK